MSTDEENIQTSPPYSEPTPNTNKDGINNLLKVTSCPNQVAFCQQFRYKNRLKNISYAINSPVDLNNPSKAENAERIKRGWMNDLFGCLQPVFSIIGKNVEDRNYFKDEWEIPFEKITQLQFLGCGGQGAVFFGMLDENPVAVKKVNELKDTEIKNLRKLNHPNIVKFKGICTQEHCFCIVMEFCPYGTLFNLLKDQSNIITINRVILWAKQIANGMQYLHTQNIIHRDLKSPNVLIGDNETIKISDFGTCRDFSGKSEKMTFAGTVAWMAPEVIKEQVCSEKVDVWSFGIVLWELLTCEVPYKGLEQSAIMYSVGSGKLKPHIPDTCPDGFKLIMNMCWKMNPRERPSFKLICNHIEIASVEILAKFKEKEFILSQKQWKAEIKTKIDLFMEQFQKLQIEYKFKEEQLIQRRQMELKHIRDVRELYDKKLETVNKLYLELNAALSNASRNVQIQDIESINQKLLSISQDYGLDSLNANKIINHKLMADSGNSIVGDEEMEPHIHVNGNKNNKPQTVILQQFEGEERSNYVKIHYMAANQNYDDISENNIDENLNRTEDHSLGKCLEEDLYENGNMEPEPEQRKCIAYRKNM